MTPDRIFVVDDDPGIVRAVHDVLTSEGYSVDGASDSIVALRTILREPPTLVILDVKMPRLDGWELCDILRRQQATSGIPILFLTACSEPLDQITAMQAGGTDHLAKPFRPELLREKVRGLTVRRAGERA
jgi:DNA-binding response OmpR family regulator